MSFVGNGINPCLFVLTLYLMPSTAIWTTAQLQPSHIGDFANKGTLTIPPKPHEWTVERQKKNRKQRREK